MMLLMTGGRSVIPKRCIVLLLLIQFTGFTETATFMAHWWCRLTDCCNDDYITHDFRGLEKDLASKLCGQHLVQSAVLAHIKGHYVDLRPKKALVLSFHGTEGVGKSYRKLKELIERAISLCERSLFIFEEVDKLPPSLLDVLLPYLEYYEPMDGFDYRKATFIFISNSAGTNIAEVLANHLKSGKQREDLQLYDIENRVMTAIDEDEKNGMYESELIKKHLITAYVPFLPLEREHVIKCIRDSLVEKGIYKNHEEVEYKDVLAVLQELRFSPKVQGTHVSFPRSDKKVKTTNQEIEFSRTGCKRVDEKVEYARRKLRAKVEL